MIEDVKAIEQIIKENLVITDDAGYDYTSRKMIPVYHDPRPETLRVQTLTGFVCFALTQQAADLVEDSGDPLVTVSSHDVVIFETAPYGPSFQRLTMIVAGCDRPSFPFGEWLHQENFIIGAMSMIEDTEDRAKILAYTGKLSIDQSVKTEDDGVTQIAKVMKGISGGVTESATLPSRVVLRPIRTFSEVDQPESEFIFRVRSSGESVQCALFEADGGAWKNEAMGRIADYLVDALPKTTVIA